MKQKHFYIVLLLALAMVTIPITYFYISTSTNSQLKNEILLRKIGHDVLLSSNDKTSKVEPIKSISTNKFQIRFENKFAFIPDSLIYIVQNNLSKSTFPKEYSVAVQKNSNDAIVYGFHMDSESNKNVITCIGRKMPLDYYKITITFVPKNDVSSTKYLLFVPTLLIVLIGCWIIFKSRKTTTDLVVKNDESVIIIGQYEFYFKQNLLQLDDKLLSLTPKESKLLYILSSSPNEVIDRTTLQKEIWENEGVIVTRSLDMFISKLRKKLEQDSSIAIVNIHGIGYKIEIKC